MPIRRKLLIVFLVIGIIPIMCAGVLSFTQTSNALRRSALSTLEVIADLKIKRLELFFDSVGADLQIAQDYYHLQSHFPILTTFASDRTQPEYLSAVAALDGQLRTFASVKGYMDIVLADPQGRIIYRLAKGRSSLELDRFLGDVEPDAFRGAQKGVYIAQVFLHKAIDNTFFMLATAPLKHADGTTAGFLAFQVPLRTIYTLIQDVTGLGDTGETVIGAPEEDSVLFLNPVRYDQESALTRRVRFGDSQALPMQEAAQGRSGSGVSVDYRGAEVLAAWRHIPSMNWGLVTKMDAREAFAEVRSLKLLLLLVSLIVFLVVVVMAFLFARTISNPLRALQRGAEVIGRGDLTYSVRTAAADEVGQLSRAFDDMVGALREKSSELERSNKELQTILYVTSHDLREPLRGIESFSQLVHDEYAERLGGEGQDFLQRIVKGVNRMRLLMDDLLALSRARRIVVPTEELDSQLIVQEVLARLEHAIKRTGARITVEPNLPRLRADQTWATQGVYNLVANALKFTREGEAPNIDIAAFRSDGPDRDQVGLVVRDRGPGVAPEQREPIFELFHRAVGREVEGTGAGLAIVRAVAERHGGRAWVRPREDGGSEFIITFGPRQAETRENRQEGPR